MLTRTLQLAIVFGAVGSMAVALSVLFIGYGGSGETAEATLANQTSTATDDAYLEPCYGCEPTEDDYENLTTFELLAIYPELSGDPIGNATDASGEDDEISPETETSEEINVNVTESAQISDDSAGGNTTGGNATMPEALPDIDENNCNATDC
jgi:hypothetical protein